MNTDIVEIINRLTNSGIKNIKVGNGVIQFDDPSCIYAAFDTILNTAWIVIVVLTAFMLLGWAILYIKNGVKIENLFNNAKAIILIFCILGAIKPIINVIYGDNLFAKACHPRQVSINTVVDMVNSGKKMLSDKDENSLYEILEVSIHDTTNDTYVDDND